MRIDDPRNGFPFDRVRAAQRYLYAVKPWWARFGGRLTLVPTYTDPAPGQQWGAVPSTDQGMRLYVDRTFALLAPLHYVAGALENVYRHHTHSTWRRLRYLSADDWRQYANIAFNLEINSAVDREQQELDPDRIHFHLRKSLVFSQSDFRRWEVTGAPGLDGEGWSPRALELPEGLSAEDYLPLIRRSEEMYENNEEALSDEGEQPDEEEDSLGEAAPSEDEPDAGQPGGLQNEGADGDGDNEDSESPDTTGEGAEGGDEHPEGEPDAEGSGPGEGSDPESSDQDGAGAESDPDADGEDSEGEGDGKSDSPGETADGDGEGEQDQEGAEGEGAAGSGQEGEQQDGSGADGQEGDQEDSGSSGQQDQPSAESGSQGAPGAEGSPGEGGAGEGQQPGDKTGGVQPSPELGERISDMRFEDHNDLWASQVQNPDDPLSTPVWKPEAEDNAPPVPPNEVAEAYRELNEDIRKAESNGMVGAGNGLAEGAGSMIEWSRGYRQANGLNWQQQLERSFAAGVTTAKARGQSDLSYSVRNPNQQAFGPILPGLHSYAPEIGILYDISGSMRQGNSMTRGMTAFTSLMDAVSAKYGTKTLWVSADTQIKDVGYSSRWNDILQEQFRWTGGGTDFGDVIQQMMSDRIMFKGRRYRKLDFVVAATDCQFQWPEERPRTRARLLVVNVGDRKLAERYLPDWLNRKTELIHVEE